MLPRFYISYNVQSWHVSKKLLRSCTSLHILPASSCYTRGITWRSSLACGVKEIFATRLAFAALKAHTATMADFSRLFIFPLFARFRVDKRSRPDMDIHLTLNTRLNHRMQRSSFPQRDPPKNNIHIRIHVSFDSLEHIQTRFVALTLLLRTYQWLCGWNWLLAHKTCLFWPVFSIHVYHCLSTGWFGLCWWGLMYGSMPWSHLVCGCVGCSGWVWIQVMKYMMEIYRNQKTCGERTCF